MREMLIVYVGLLIVVSLTSVCCAEPLEFGASEPVDHTIEMYHGKKIIHSSGPAVSCTPYYENGQKLSCTVMHPVC